MARLQPELLQIRPPALRRSLRIAIYALAVLLLTFLTQIGGLVLLVTLLLARLFRLRMRVASFGLFAGLYLAATVVSAHVAPVFGRVPLTCSPNASALRMQSWLYCALNRNYVTPVTKSAAEALSRHMAQAYPGTITLTLDGNFPFLEGFPLLPHLSHSDGKKLDIAFYYKDADGRAIDGAARSPVGYFAFEQPRAGEPLPCKGRGDLLTLRWDLPLLQPLFPAWTLDEVRTAAALTWLASEGRAFGVEKIFVEPHLAARLRVGGETIRFQGCRAARHDDHIHFQVTE